MKILTPILTQINLEICHNLAAKMTMTKIVQSRCIYRYVLRFMGNFFNSNLTVFIKKNLRMSIKCVFKWKFSIFVILK